MKKGKIEYTVEEAIELWNRNIPSLNAKLEKVFGIETFKPKNIMNLVKTFQDALDIYLQTNTLPPFKKYILEYDGDDPDALNTQAYEKLKIIVKVTNQGLVPDWANTSQRKWYPWFYMSPFAFDGTCCVASGTCGASRLCVHSEELAIYLGETFTDIYEIYYSK